jgi:hypothetical protein
LRFLLLGGLAQNDSINQLNDDARKKYIKCNLEAGLLLSCPWRHPSRANAKSQPVLIRHVCALSRVIGSVVGWIDLPMVAPFVLWNLPFGLHQELDAEELRSTTSILFFNHGNVTCEFDKISNLQNSHFGPSFIV